jgi:uncharacterized repeat protein (TIGR01451 family)
MRKASILPLKTNHTLFALSRTLRLALAAVCLFLAPIARSQTFVPGNPTDVTAQLGNEVNPSITIDGGNPSNIVVVAASETLGLVNPLVVSYSVNKGKTWATNIIAAEDPLPINTAYYVGLEEGQSGMIYTTDTLSNGIAGDSSFTDIQPTNYISLTFSVAATDNGTAASNYFAIEMGTDWFVSTNLLVGSTPPGSDFVYVSTPYTNLASAWNQLKINSAGVTIGPPGTNDLSGLITGVGIVELGPGGWSYNQFQIAAKVNTVITTNIYVEDWGSIKGGSSATLPTVGWRVVSATTNNPPSAGIIQVEGARNATGEDALQPAYGYPSAAFDSYGNLYVSYIPSGFQGVAIALSTNFGASFMPLTFLASADATEAPRIAGGPATDPGTAWVVYKDYSLPGTPLMAQGFLATNLGTNILFGQPLTIPGTSAGGYPDVSVGPAGQVMVAYQNNLTNSGASKIFVNLNTNAFGTNGFGQPITVTSDAVGGLTYIPAQSTGIGIDAAVGVAWDADAYSPYYGRAYVIYSALAGGTQEIGFRYSTNSGTSWSSEDILNDDTSGNSHFMPRVAVDPVTGIVATSWYDCRNDQGSGTPPIVQTTSKSVGFKQLAVTSVLISSNGITNPSLDIETNQIDPTTIGLTISGNNLLGTIVSNNNTNIIYILAAGKPYITVTFEGEMGTNAGSTNTTVMLTITDTLPDVYTSGSASDLEPVVYTTISAKGGTSFVPNEQAVSSAVQINPNSPINPPVFGYGSLNIGSQSPLGFGNYTGLAFYAGQFYPAWADNSDIGLTNPNGPLSNFDITISQVVVPTADLTLSVSNFPNPVLSDGVIAYYLQVINNGPNASTCVVTDVLPANVTFVPAQTVPSLGATYTFKNQVFVLTVPSLAAHTSATTLVVTRAGSSGYATNFASISGPLPDPVPSNNTNILVTLFEGEDLALSMSTSATNVFGGQVVTNMISVTNFGPSGNGDITISNVYSANWGSLSVLLDGWNLALNAVTPGTYSTNGNVLVLNVGTLGSNQSTNILIAATPLATSKSGSVASSVSSLGFDPNPGNNSAVISYAMTAETIGATLTAGPSQVGAPTTFTVTVTNFGPSPFGFITVSNVFPTNFGTISALQSSNMATISNNTIVIPIGILGSNESASVSFLAVPQSLGTVTNVCVVSCFDFAPSVTNSILITPAKPATPIENFHVQPASSGAFVVWDTPFPATVQVDYGVTPAYGSISSVSGPSTHHVVLLSGLSRDTNYYFNALTTENGTLYTTNGMFATVNTLILNTQDALYQGPWTENSAGAGIFGSYYFSANTSVVNPTASATFAPMITTAGDYDVSIWYPVSTGFATNTPIFVSGGTNELFESVNEALNGGSWQPLATNLYFAAGVAGNVSIYNNTGSTNSAVAANAMRWVYNSAQDNPGNGNVPAWWSTFFFGTNNVPASDDSDGDGYSNYAEYIFGTDPTNAASSLNFTVTPVAGNMVSVKFSPYQGGRSYHLQISTNLEDSLWLSLTNVPAVDTNGIGSFTVPQPSPDMNFYRLSATLTP